jgi:hypothetical protein
MIIAAVKPEIVKMLDVIHRLEMLDYKLSHMSIAWPCPIGLNS